MDRVVIDGRAFYKDRGHLGRDRGRSLKRLHRPNRFRVWLHELRGESGSQYHYGLNPVTLNAGLMKPRRGFTLAAGEEKQGVGKQGPSVDKPGRFHYFSQNV